MKVSIQKLLEQTRRGHGLNKSEMARRLGVASQLYGRYERGEITPKWDFLRKFEAEFDLNIEPVNEQKVSKTGTPLISLEVAAGFGNEVFAIREEDVQARYVVPDFSDIDFMIRVKGSSMYPKYSSGDIVACRIIRESKFIQWNKVYVIATTEQGILCKRLKQSKEPDCLLAVSDNKEYEPFDLPKNEITGLALVVGVIRLE